MGTFGTLDSIDRKAEGEGIMGASPPKPYFSHDVRSKLIVKEGSRILQKPQLNRQDDLRMRRLGLLWQVGQKQYQKTIGWNVPDKMPAHRR